MEIDERRFAARLVELERTPAWVAAKLNIHRATLHHYVKDGRRLPERLYPQLVAVLGTTDFVREQAA